jgi:PEGA domain-containing protein
MSVVRRLKDIAVRILLVSWSLQCLLYPTFVEAYDLSHSTLRKSPSSPFSVALVPFAESRTRPLDDLMNRMRSELGRTKGVRIMDQADTEEILRYYLKYVNAASEDDAVQRSLTEARQSLLAGNYPQADSLLAAAERKILAKVSAGGSNEGLYQIHLLRAKVRHASGSKQGVNQEYDQLAHLAPTLELDPNLYSNWERSALQAAKKRVADMNLASVHVAAAPEGSEVFLNGIHQGIAPITLKNLPAGLHVVEVKTVHHAAFLQQVNLNAGDAMTINARLQRTDLAGGEVAAETVTIRPSLYRTDLEISRLISTLGYHLGVDRIILVSDKRSGGTDSFLYRIGDTGLGSVQREHQVAISSAHPAEGVSGIVGAMNKEVRTDILKDPPKYADQSVGSLKLHEKRRKPFYKKPLFWVLTAAAAGTGGALAAALAPAAATGAIVIGF